MFLSTSQQSVPSDLTMGTYQELTTNNREPEMQDLTLTVIFEDEEFSIRVCSASSATVADLAGLVHATTGILPHRQRLAFKGMVFDPPDTDVWAPLLTDLNVRSGDRVDVSKSARPLGEQDSDTELDVIGDKLHKLAGDVDDLEAKRDRVQQGYIEVGNEVMALTFLKQDFECIKQKLMENVQVLNSLNFDHRNALGQAKRRDLVDQCQRQIDKCSDMSAAIFHKLAQAHYLSNVGKIYSQDFRLPPARSGQWTKQQL